MVAFCGNIMAQDKIWRIAPPQGFIRRETTEYGAFIRDLQLKPQGSKVRLYDGTEKNWYGWDYAVIDMEIGTTDLQQCADVIMRIRAEFLWKNKRFDEIHFNFTNGFKADYSMWAKGYRISVRGNIVKWYKAYGEDYSYSTFRDYLDVVFMYAGTASLSKELVSVDFSQLQIGDVFIVGGHPGHAMMIVDMVVDYMGNKAILVAHGYSPAQDMHIVKNLKDKTNSPWYIINQNTTAFDFPTHHFKIDQIMRFK